MMSCVGCSRSYTIPKLFPCSKTISSQTNNSNICLPKYSNSTTVKRRRTRRGRPRARDSYTKAIAAFYTIFPDENDVDGDVCPLLNIEPRSPAEKTESLQELPALLSRLREAEEELPLILSNFNRVDSPSHSHSKQASEFDEESKEGGLTEECCEVESFLEATHIDIEGGMDTILGGISASASVEQRHPDVVDPTAYVSAIRGLRRGGVWKRQMRFNKKEMNAMSFCSLDKAPRKPSLKLDYEQVLTAWSGRGSLYIDDGDGDVDGECPQIDYYDDDDDIENVHIALVPDVSFWRGADLQCNVNIVQEKGGEEEGGGGGGRGGARWRWRCRGMREARVLRYKEKRQTRLFSKKIRYQVRKLNAEKRPRLKGRFVKEER